MSTVPPAPPSTPAVNPLPWEARQSRGLLEAFFDTMGLFVSRPREAWARTRESGDIASPLLFGIVICWFSFVVHSLIGRLITAPLLPGPLGKHLGTMGGYRGAGFVFQLIFSPIFIVIGLFIGAAILHVCCMLVGALSNSPSGFEGTFRAVAYAEVSSIASIIPVVGGLIALAWWIVLAVTGVERLHHTTQGKAVTAVLIPVVVCCGGLLLIVLFAAGALLMRGAH